MWAIGTGEVATPDGRPGGLRGAPRPGSPSVYTGDLAAGVRILYGGSVKAGNVGGIMAQPDVDGALVGGASIDADSFAGIVTATADSP